jgi:hypothetical protein
MPSKTMPADICLKMVEAATRSCQPAPPAQTLAPPLPVPASPNWDAMAASFASLSNAFAWGSIVLALIAVAVAIAWGKIVTASAEKEAKAMAKACADEYIQGWLAKEAPGIIRERVDFILDATLGSGDDSEAADAIGREA